MCGNRPLSHAMDWQKWIADLLAAALCGLIGGTVGVFFRGYFTKKGEHLATYRDIAFLLAQERGKSYEQEKGKRLATHEDIENVLKEVQAVTRETETIKAQIGSDLWTRQKVWEQKREAYAKVLAISHDLRECLIDISKDIDTPREKTPEFTVLWRRYFYELGPSLQREIDVAEIFSGPEGGKVLQELRHWRNSTESGTAFQARVDFVAAWRTRLIEAARKDLGVPER